MKTDKNLILLADAYKYSHHKLYYLGKTKFTLTWKVVADGLMKLCFLDYSIT